MPKPDAKKSPDDLVSWLQYPIEDSFEKTYCSASFDDDPAWPLPQHHASVVVSNPLAAPHTDRASPPSSERPLNAQAARSKSSPFHSAPSAAPPIQGSHGLHRSSSEIAQGAMALGAQRAERSLSFSSSGGGGGGGGSGGGGGGGGRAKARKSRHELLSHQFDSSSIQLSGSSLITHDSIPATASSEYNASGEYASASASASISTSAPTSGSMISSSSFAACHGVEQQRGFRVASSSQAGSLGSVDLAPKAEICKEKLHVAAATTTDGSESQSEDADDECVEIKRPRRTSSKRNRAAEVHNLSERNRRNRINEKLKALQELIPNSTKTDKASVLDEAIEYMKSLQMQLQMVSMRNSGMNVSPAVVPVGFPHLAAAPQHTMGLGLPIGHPGMGIGMYGPAMVGGPYQAAIPRVSPYGIPYQDGGIVQSQPYTDASGAPSQAYPEGCNAPVQAYRDAESRQAFRGQCSVESEAFEKVDFPHGDEA